MVRNMNPVDPIADWYTISRVLDRSLLGHVCNGDGSRHVKSEISARRGTELDARVKAA